MILSPGTRVGPYEVVAPLGAGGMGEVYRARDTKLGRDVALKILPDAFTLDHDRNARFKREAQVLASLNHPNIAAIYGFEDSSNGHALVLELVDGPTLADRIALGPLPLEEILPIARQIAEALDAAHEQGVTHRDLKPANISVRPDGTVKVLDFGLAKAMGASTGRYVASGHVVYNRDGPQSLMALPFDLARLQVTGGPAVALAEQVWEGGAEGAQYAVSDAATMAYVYGDPRRYERRLAWVDRKGSVEPLLAPPRPYYDPRISPDGRQVAASSEESTERVWIYDFARSTLTALTSTGSSQAPLWTPDGTRVIYRGSRAGFRNLYWKAADGSGEEERLTTSDNLQTPISMSPDGKRLAFAAIDPTTGSDIWLMSLDGNRKPEPFLRSHATEANPHFSPDGRWLAYTSNESGRIEVYVQPVPGPGGKRTISTDGGNEPVWSRDGRELFYRNGDRMMVVAIATQPTFVAGLPRLLFQGRYEPTGTGTSGFDVSADGRRFLMIQPSEPEHPATEVSVVINWFEELKARVPVGQPTR